MSACLYPPRCAAPGWDRRGSASSGGPVVRNSVPAKVFGPVCSAVIDMYQRLAVGVVREPGGEDHVALVGEVDAPAGFRLRGRIPPQPWKLRVAPSDTTSITLTVVAVRPTLSSHGEPHAESSGAGRLDRRSDRVCRSDEARDDAAAIGDFPVIRDDATPRAGDGRCGAQRHDLPRDGTGGATVMCACRPSAALTAAPASSMPAPHTAVVQ